jgi:hypothetical protein
MITADDTSILIINKMRTQNIRRNSLNVSHTDSDIQLIRRNQLTAAGSAELAVVEHSAALYAVKFAVIDGCRRSHSLGNKCCSAGSAEFAALKSLATGWAYKTAVLCRRCRRGFAIHRYKVAAAGSAELALIQNLAANLAYQFARSFFVCR